MKNLFRIALAVLALAPSVASLSAGCCGFNPCQGGPLKCGSLSLMVKGGVTPSGWTHKGPVWLTIPANTPPVITVSVISGFSTQFDVPWNVGAEFGWNASCRVQYFLEYAHTHANGKHTAFTAGAFAVDETFTDYNVNAGYLGARYYFEGCCFPCLGKISPFVGFKAGFATRKKMTYGLGLGGTFIASNPYYLANTVPSMGLLIGAEWWFSNCISAVLQGEFNGSCMMKSNRNVVYDPTVTGGLTNVNIGSTGWVIGWPITLGLRWTF